MGLRRRRLLLLNSGYDATGADRAARELFERLPAAGWDAELWVGFAPARPVPGVHVVPWRAERLITPLDAVWPHNDWRHAGSRWKLSHVGPDKFDLVHVHCPMGRWLSIRALSSLAKRMPLIWTMHDEWAITGGLVADLGQLVTPRDVPGLPLPWKPQVRLFQGWRTRPIREALRRWQVSARLLIAPSHHIAEKVPQAPWFDGIPVQIVRNGVTMAEERAAVMAREEASRSWGLMPGQPVVLLIAGSLGEPIKGVRLGLAALGHIPRDAGIQVLLVGNGAKDIIRDAPPGLKIVKAGPVLGNAALARAYRAADVTIIPSLMESLSYVGMESLACETPFVSFDVGGLHEIGASGGAIAVPPYDTRAMGEAIARLIADPARRNTMGSIGRDWVIREASMPQYLASITDLYDQITGLG